MFVSSCTISRVLNRMRNHLFSSWLRHYKNFATKKSFNFSTLASAFDHQTKNNPCLPFLKLKSRRHQLLSLLQSLTRSNPILQHKEVHALIVVSGLESDSYATNALLKSYSECDLLHYARDLFDKMPEKNLVSWSSMVSMYTQHGFNEEALLVFLNFRRRCHESPNEYILASAMRACTQLGGGGRGEQVHGFVVKGGFHQDVYVATALVDFYAKTGEIDKARMIFDGLMEKSAVTWTTIITGYVRTGRAEVSLKLFSQMREVKAVPDKYVLSSVLSACSMLEFVEGGKQIHGHVVRGNEMDVSVVNALIDFYVKCGQVQISRKLFDQMVDRNVISWTAMIAGYMQNSFDREAMKLFVEMIRLGWKPDAFACSSIFISCGSLGVLEQGKQLHAYSIKANIESDLYVKNGLIDMYAKCESLTDARRAFEVMDDRNLVSYNAIIEGHSRCEQISEALNIFHEMRLSMLQPSILTFVSLLGVSAALSTFELSKQIHALIIKFGVFLDRFAGSALIDVYSKCSCVMDARLVFNEMDGKDIVVWNAMFFGYAQQSENEEAFRLYSELQLSEQKPDDFTFAALITAASNLASLQHGQQFHNHIIKIGLDFDPFVTNSLVDMYAKCGSFEGARKSFSSTIWRDVVCWNSMISAYAHHGEAEEALQMFEDMIKEGITPNYVTFINVLSACSHAGLVEDGLRHFHLMPEFGTEPGNEHYACVVSLLGRAGKLYEAKELIEKMPTQPTAAVWRSLLGACKIAGNVELGKYAAEMAISVDPRDSGSYTLLSNIFASRGMWGDVKLVRERMDFSGVAKEPGHSWIEVNKEVHLFIAGDRNHCKIELIYSVLDELILQIKGERYVPDTLYF